jgi:hypothetical protein
MISGVDMLRGLLLNGSTGVLKIRESPTDWIKIMCSGPGGPGGSGERVLVVVHVEPG